MMGKWRYNGFSANHADGRDSDMELAEIIAVAAILIAFFALMWQMNFQSNRTRDELRDEIRETRDAIRSLDGRLSEAERAQARLEGANSMLRDVIIQRSHTHEAD